MSTTCDEHNLSYLRLVGQPAATADTDDHYSHYLFSESVGNRHTLTIVSADRLLTGFIDYDDYRSSNPDNETADELDDRYRQLREALCNGSAPMRSSDDSDTAAVADYCYEFDLRPDNTVNITVAVYDGQEVIARTELFSITCRPLASNTLMDNVFAKLVTVFAANRRRIDTLVTENGRLRQLADRSVNELDDFAVRKEENDSLLFTRFVAILNAKKQKIRELEDVFNK